VASNLPDNYIENETYDDADWDMACEIFSTDNPTPDQLEKAHQELLDYLDKWFLLFPVSFGLPGLRGIMQKDFSHRSSWRVCLICKEEFWADTAKICRECLHKKTYKQYMSELNHEESHMNHLTYVKGCPICELKYMRVSDEGVVIWKK
jgi:hypothetical protein